MKQACGSVPLKTILGTGQLGTLTNVYKASLVCMMAGSDFIKTSTGKEAVNATFPVALTMLRAIREFYQRTGYKVGFKPAGTIVYLIILYNAINSIIHIIFTIGTLCIYIYSGNLVLRLSCIVLSAFLVRYQSYFFLPLPCIKWLLYIRNITLLYCLVRI